MWLIVWGSGNHSLRKFLSNFAMQFSDFLEIADKNSYYRAYTFILGKKERRKLCIQSLFRASQERLKFIALVCTAPLIVVFRDPISMAKTYVNHLGKCKKQDDFTLACDTKDLFVFLFIQIIAIIQN